MKKTLLIATGTILISIIIAIFLYLFVFGTPRSGEQIFANLGFTSSTDDVVTAIEKNETVPDDIAPAEDMASHFVQVTERAVAGAHVKNGVIRFVEQGTGHVYEKSSTSGSEVLVSGVTIPKATHATFSSDGSRVAISSSDGDSALTTIATLGAGGDVTGITLPRDAREVTFNSSTTLYYILKNNSGASGFLFNIETEKSTEIFALPLSDIHVLWGNPHYVYTTPTETQKGYLYEVVGKGTLAYVTPGMPGLVGFRYGDGIIVSSLHGSTITTRAISTSGNTVTQAFPFIPEKCTMRGADSSFVYCGIPSEFNGAFPDDWYMGTQSYSDKLWLMSVETGDALLLLDFVEISGREIDVAYIQSDESGSQLVLINKNDNTLWLYNETLR
ncbi:MAG TPA: hypothetical protein VFV22_00230 [Candidatus Paceibacterota bacterium]|nr:hypothetical protein [Candidatus Paceibacterota bacterium]